MNNKVIIIGGGPAGLFCAYLLLKAGVGVDLYDQSSGLAKKFLIAGNGGLNLTHSEDLSSFASRYDDKQKLFLELLNEFSPTDLRAWCKDLGVETFIGTSGRVFPEKLKAGEILVKWSKHLKSYQNFTLNLNHSLISIDDHKELTFLHKKEKVTAKASKIILALGGASWQSTGSDGKWKALLDNIGIKTQEFLPMNCGFECSWSDYFKEKIDRTPLKNVVLTLDKKKIRSELMLTPFGLEGSGIYALSKQIRDKILKDGSATISIDLKPDLSLEEIETKLSQKKTKTSLSNHLRKSLSISSEVFILMKEIVPEGSVENYAQLIKDLKITLTDIRPIDEAISTSGGVCFEGLNRFFESKEIKDLYFAGEMLNFDAPTGGYLLQGCFSTAYRVVQGILGHDKSS